MKKVILTLFVLLLSLWTLGQNKSTAFVSGKITNPVGTAVSVYYYPTSVHPEPDVFKTELNEDGTFSMEVILDRAREVTFRHGRETTSMFLHPADQIELELDPEQFDESIRFNGHFPGVDASNFLAQWYLTFEDTEPFQAHRRAMSEAGSMEHMVAIEEARSNAQREFWITMGGAEKFSSEFAMYMEARLTYSALSDRMGVPEYFRYVSKAAEGEDAPLAEGFYEFLETAKINDEEILHVEAYQAFLEEYLSHLVKERMGNNITRANWRNLLCDMAASELEGEIGTLMQAKFIKEGLSYGNPLNVKEPMENLGGHENGQYYQSLLKPMYENAMKLAPGKPAPTFTLEDAEGNEVSLSDFRGKVVYVDFWASWCRPCRAEMPYSRKLIEEFSGQEDMVFLFISIDDDIEAWHTAREDENLNGVHLYSQGFGSEVPTAYQVNAIPNYFLIGRDGTMFDPFPPRPSNGNIREVLGEALSQNR